MDSIDDNEELEYTEDAFNVLGFSTEEKFDCYMLTAAVMTCGGIEFKTKGRDDQAECENISADSNILHISNENSSVSMQLPHLMGLF